MTLAFSADTLASMPQTVFPVRGRTGSLLAMAERIGRIGSWMMTLADQQLEYSGECAAILGLADPQQLVHGCNNQATPVIDTV